jgi:hypothetical protein
MNRDKFNIHNELSITRAEGNRMTVMLNRSILSVLLGGCIAGAALVGAALSQPPGGGPPGSGGGGGPGGGGPGGGPGGGGKTSPTVNYQVCNKTNDVPIIFVTTVSIVGGKHNVGWICRFWHENQRKCGDYRRFYNPNGSGYAGDW